MRGATSLYAKDNFNYTRAWIADYSPYLMFGANAQYAFDDKWSGAFIIINEYFHLQNANNLPSDGAQEGDARPRSSAVSRRHRTKQDLRRALQMHKEIQDMRRKEAPRNVA